MPRLVRNAQSDTCLCHNLYLWWLVLHTISSYPGLAVKLIAMVLESVSTVKYRLYHKHKWNKRFTPRVGSMSDVTACTTEAIEIAMW